MVRLPLHASVDVAQFVKRFLHRTLVPDQYRVVVDQGLLRCEDVLRYVRFANVVRLALATSIVGIDCEVAPSPDAKESIQKIQDVGSNRMAIVGTRRIHCSDANRLVKNSGLVVEFQTRDAVFQFLLEQPCWLCN